MRSFATLLAFMVMAMALTFCNAAPHTKPSHDVSRNVGDLIDTNIIADDPTTNGTDDTNTQNMCYDWDSSEKWKDVGGQHSEFVNQSVYDLCQLIAIEAYKGFPSGNTLAHCKEVRHGSHGRDYDRSIGIALRYLGPQLQYNHISAGYCNDRMAQPMACGAGGEFDVRVYNPNLPKPWVSDRWAVKADPNRGDCRSNGYNSDL
ncbi:hypothetical protein INS49_015915 [Diaporthe citri]|uniref:uncharacterized protein n=1 Tax=Diaporthe citri TaxID=83186 RepID=UPI001C7F8C71|nr:uncharacterized protein INS49_015915 [Diaporthe citri]KAG6356527.1 hypothetical protein INS49_015915 [Diaporthe citri]